MGQHEQWIHLHLCLCGVLFSKEVALDNILVYMVLPGVRVLEDQTFKEQISNRGGREG